jgi:hypothetical protein
MPVIACADSLNPGSARHCGPIVWVAHWRIARGKHARKVRTIERRLELATGAIERATRSLRGRLLAGLLVTAMALSLGYAFGSRHPHVTTRTGMCLSAENAITCESGGTDYWIPTDVQWEDASSSHLGGRPTCLPPTGIGLEGPVWFGTVDVDSALGSYPQVVWVSCNGR